MADELLGASLDLDIAGALSTVDALGSAIEAAVTTGADVFSSVMESAISAVPDVVVTPDVSAVEPDIAGAIDASATTQPAIVPDVASVEPDISAAVASADGAVPIVAEGTGDITGEIDAAVGAADASVTVTADTDPAASAAQDLVTGIDGETASISVDADTSEAQASLDDLGGAATAAGGAMQRASGGGDSFKASAEGVAAGTALATGSTKELSGFVGGLSPGFAAAATGAVGLGAGLFELFNKGEQAVSATQRFNLIVGDMAGAVESVHVGSLNTDLTALGREMGDTRYQTETAAATIFQFATNAGAGGKQAANFSGDLFALAARAVALNPALGDVSDVATRMEIGLGRARSAAQQFGISISQLEINQRAQADTGKQSASELTAYEKSLAGAEIAVERYGSTLGATVTAGSANAAIAQRRLTSEFDQFLEDIGKPLVFPGLDVLESAIPVGEAFGSVLANVGSDVLPVLTTGLEAVGAVAGVAADALGALGPIAPLLATGFLVFEGVTRLLPLALGLATSAAISATEAFPALAGAVGISTASIEAGEIAIAGALGPVGLIAGALAIGASAFGLFGGGAEQGSQQLDSFTSSVTAAGGAVDEAAAKAARGYLEERGNLDDLARAHVTLASVLAVTNTMTETQAQTVRDADISWSLHDITTRQFIATVRAADPAMGALLSRFQREGELTPGLVGSIAELGTKHAQAAKAIADQSATQSRDNEIAGAAAVAQQKLASAHDIAAAAQKAAAEGAKAVGLEEANASTAFDAAHDASVRYGLGIGTAADLTNALKTADQELSAELDILFGRFLSADQATNSYKESVLTLGDTLFANGFAFDDNTKAGLANQDALDAVGAKAAAAASAIFKSSGDIGAAKQPLEDFRGVVQRLRDGMAAAGQDTSFLDGILANTDAAIAGIGGKVPAAQAAGTGLAGGVRSGIDSQQPAAFAAGANMGLSAATGAGSTVGTHNATGLGLGGALVGGVLGNVGRAIGAGSALGGSSAAGAGSQQGLHSFIGAVLGGALAGGVGSAGAALAAAAAGVAAQGPGAARGFYGPYYDAGASSSSGLAAGVTSVSGAVAAAARGVAQAAVNAARELFAAVSPSRVFMDIGHDVGTGLVIGLNDSVAPVSAAGARMAAAAVPGDLRAAWTPYVPAGGRGSARDGGDGVTIQFHIKVEGVADPVTARAVGEQIGDGAADALAQRGVVVAARLG